jgi:hypothetical protein
MAKLGHRKMGKIMLINHEMERGTLLSDKSEGPCQSWFFSVCFTNKIPMLLSDSPKIKHCSGAPATTSLNFTQVLHMPPTAALTTATPKVCVDPRPQSANGSA